MTTQPTHTPTPYQPSYANTPLSVSKIDIPGKPSRFVIFKGSVPIADCLTRQEDAAYIVKCVNAHEELIACLKDLAHYTQHQIGATALADRVKQAIAKADGRS